MTGGTTTPTQRSSRLMEPNHFSILIENMLKAEDKARHMGARLRQSTPSISEGPKPEQPMQHCSEHSASFLAWNLSYCHWKSNKTHFLLKSIVLTKYRVSHSSAHQQSNLLTSITRWKLVRFTYKQQQSLAYHICNASFSDTKSSHCFLHPIRREQVNLATDISRCEFNEEAISFWKTSFCKLFV